MAETSTSDKHEHSPQKRHWLWGGMAAAIAALVAACSSTPPSAPVKAGSEYRKEAARHLYDRNPQRIYAGKLPPMLYAVGVLQVELNAKGGVQRLNWLRAPRHAPEVIAEIERTVRAAAPFPTPPSGGSKTIYTDTWLWDKSGRFQLDTLTEGQLGQ